MEEKTKSALIVVDVQVAVMEEGWESPRVIANIVKAVDRAREAGVPVIWVQHSGEEMVRESPEWQLVPELHPNSDELLIDKDFNSAFEGTELDAKLKELDVGHVVLAGAATNWCIRATAYGALDRGYDLTLLKDAHTTGDMELSPTRRIAAADIIDELNVGLTWVTYPDRTSATAEAGTYDFG